MSQVITQNGDPVDDKGEEEDENFEPLENLAEAINEVSSGVRKFRNSIIIKVGIVLVTMKALDVVGKIIIENNRAKRESNDENV
jgi:hypothetical protein